MIYLDNSATTMPDPTVLATFNKVSTEFFGNPSSLHILGAKAEQFFHKVRLQAADLLKSNSKEIIFTSGGTESNNLAIKGVANYYKGRGNHIITTEIEHPSVYEACKQLEADGFKVTYLKVNDQGIIDIKELENAITEETILVSIMHVNNEIGSIQPINKIAKMLKEYKKIIFHTDAVQSFSKIPINLDGIDLMSISGHKLNGLRGTGLLYVKSSIQLTPLFAGGEQEFNLRSGTENVAGFAALVRAMRLSLDKLSIANELNSLKENLKTKLSEIEGVQVNTPDESAPHIMHFSIPGIKPETIIHALAEKEIYVSTQSACSSKSSDLSRVLDACGYNNAIASSGVRVSLSYETTEEELDYFINILNKEVQKIKEMLG